MVITHVPSNIFLILVPFMPTEFLAIVMIILRFSISQMDVPTRNAYIVGVVSEDERSGASGVTTISRSISASIGPSIAGKMLMHTSTANSIFYISGMLKLVYDFLLLLSFHVVSTDVESVEENNKRATTSEDGHFSKSASTELTPIMKA